MYICSRTYTTFHAYLCTDTQMLRICTTGNLYYADILNTYITACFFL